MVKTDQKQKQVSNINPVSRRRETPVLCSFYYHAAQGCTHHTCSNYRSFHCVFFLLLAQTRLRALRPGGASQLRSREVLTFCCFSELVYSLDGKVQEELYLTGIEKHNLSVARNDCKAAAVCLPP